MDERKMRLSIHDISNKTLVIGVPDNDICSTTEGMRTARNRDEYRMGCTNGDRIHNTRSITQNSHGRNTDARVNKQIPPPKKKRTTVDTIHRSSIQKRMENGSNHYDIRDADTDLGRE